MTIPRLLATLLLFAALAGCGNQQQAATASADTTQKDVEAIRAFLTEIEQSFNGGQIDAFMPMFTEDAVLSPQGSPDIAGAAAIRAVYEGAMNQVNMQVKFDTKEVTVFGDLAYESGTFTVKSADKTSGQSLGEVTSRHIHIFQRQKDGKWKTWRMMTNSSAAPAGG
jgi:uncharacterized protein (TIGR02246 family)